MDKKTQKNNQTDEDSPTYDSTILEFHTWLYHHGKEKLYVLANKKEGPIAFDFPPFTTTFPQYDNQELGMISQFVQGPTPKTAIEATINEIENIVKLLNKHKALLEASKGIE